MRLLSPSMFYSCLVVSGRTHSPIKQITMFMQSANEGFPALTIFNAPHLFQQPAVISCE